jgi:hypothetical protein
MTATRNHLSIRAARANALFVSPLQRSGQPSTRQIRRSTTAALGQFGARGCAERVAQEFGDHPELAATRMRWARQAVAGAFGEPASWQPGPRQAGQQPPDRAA